MSHPPHLMPASLSLSPFSPRYLPFPSLTVEAHVRKTTALCAASPPTLPARHNFLPRAACLCCDCLPSLSLPCLRPITFCASVVPLDLNSRSPHLKESRTNQLPTSASSLARPSALARSPLPFCCLSDATTPVRPLPLGDVTFVLGFQSSSLSLASCLPALTRTDARTQLVCPMRIASALSNHRDVVSCSLQPKLRKVLILVASTARLLFKRTWKITSVIHVAEIVVL